MPAMAYNDKIFGKTEHRDHVFTLGPRGSTEIGILEMLWTFKQGERVMVGAGGYRYPIVKYVP